MNDEFQIICGDALTVLRSMESESVQCAITSPPFYGLRNYNTTPQVWDQNNGCEHRWALYGQTKSSSLSGKVSPSVVDQSGQSVTRTHIEHDLEIPSALEHRDVEVSAGEKLNQLKGKISASGCETRPLSFVNVPVAVEDSAHEIPNEVIRDNRELDGETFARQDAKSGEPISQFSTPNNPTICGVSSLSDLMSNGRSRADKIPNENTAFLVDADKIDSPIISDTAISEHQPEPVGKIATPNIKTIKQNGRSVESVCNEPLLATIEGTDGIFPSVQMPSGSIDDLRTDATSNIVAGFPTSNGTGFAFAKSGSSDSKLVTAPLTNQSNTHVSMICEKCGAIKCELGLEPTFTLYISHLIEIFREVKRVLKKDGTMFINLGDSYCGGGGGNYGTGLSVSVHKTNPSILSSAKRQGIQPKSLLNIPARFAIAMTDELQMIQRNELIWHKPACMPSSAKDRWTVDFEPIYFFTKEPKYKFNQQLEQAVSTDTSVRNRDETKLNNTPGRERMNGLVTNHYEMRNPRTVRTIPFEPSSDPHFASYPTKLVEPLILAGSDEGDVVLDLFAGTGTTLLTALRNKRKALGIELNPEYVTISKRRLAEIQVRLF